jgi:preprotein translocase subunit YajC
MVGVFYLLLWRPQQRRMANVRAVQQALRVGDEVITTGGLFGTVIAMRDDLIEVEIAPNVVVRVARGAIGSRVQPDASAGAASSVIEEHHEGTDGLEETG